MGRAEGAGDAWKVGPAYAAGVDIGFEDDATVVDWIPVAAGDVTPFLGFLLRSFCLAPVSGALEFALL
jgi:hypothetical protein